MQRINLKELNGGASSVPTRDRVWLWYALDLTASKIFCLISIGAIVPIAALSSPFSKRRSSTFASAVNFEILQ